MLSNSSQSGLSMIDYTAEEQIVPLALFIARHKHKVKKVMVIAFNEDNVEPKCSYTDQNTLR